MRCDQCEKWRPTRPGWGECMAKAPEPTVRPKDQANIAYVIVWPSTPADKFCYDSFKAKG